MHSGAISSSLPHKISGYIYECLKLEIRYFVNAYRFAALLALCTSACGLAARAADFEITNGQTATTTQTLNAGETGTVDAGGILAVAGNAVTTASDSATVINDGTMNTTGASSLTIFGDTGSSNLTVINNGAITGTGNSQVGILIFDDNANVTNNGTITINCKTPVPPWARTAGTPLSPITAPSR